MVALVNPRWSLEGSIFFGCRAPHLPLKLAYSQALLDQQGHAMLLLDGQLLQLEASDIRAELAICQPDLTVVTTAPSYLFWRCPPPELRVPQQLVQEIEGAAGRVNAVGPHGSTTPRAALRKLGVAAVVMGECEETVARIAGGDWLNLPGIAYHEGDAVRINSGPRSARFVDLPALAWPDTMVRRHDHHRHRFDAEPTGPGAEVETSRGCPYSCTFCAKENFAKNIAAGCSAR